MPQIDYVVHLGNKVEADAQAEVRDGLSLMSQAISDRTRIEGDPLYRRRVNFDTSVGWEYKTDEDGEVTIKGWVPYRVFGEPVVSSPVVEEPIIEEPQIKEPVIEQPVRPKRRKKK